MMWRSLVLGVVTGLRSQVPTAMLAWRQSREQLPEDVGGPMGVLGRRGAVPASALAVVGELVADKLPETPSRLDTGPFLGRLSLGATAGAGVAAAFGRSRILGGVLGIAGAAAGSYAGTRYRALVAEHTDVPDTVWAVAEDVTAIALALAATSSSSA
jgi:uncharacterized membrane protein